jgi:hypothetical protein
MYDRTSIGCQKYWELCCEFLGVPASPMPFVEPPKEHDAKAAGQASADTGNRTTTPTQAAA